MRKPFRLLVLNPDTGSTQIGIYENEKCILEETICHEAEELSRFPRLMDQYDFRRQAVLETLNEKGINLTKFSSIVGRGGLLQPMPGGTYRVNDRMLGDLQSARYGDHVYNLGAIIAHQIAVPLNIPAFVMDPLAVDELQEPARLSGSFPFVRKSSFHALSQKSAARRLAQRMDAAYEELNLIVAHLGGSISVGAHSKGQVIDVSVLDDRLEIDRMIARGENQARLFWEAMAYQTAKEIGAAAAALDGKVHAIILTGRLSFQADFVQWIADRIGWIAPVHEMPGENELEALAEGGLRVLRKEEPAKDYPQVEPEEAVLER